MSQPSLPGASGFATLRCPIRRSALFTSALLRRPWIAATGAAVEAGSGGGTLSARNAASLCASVAGSPMSASTAASAGRVAGRSRSLSAARSDSSVPASR